VKNQMYAALVVAVVAGVPFAAFAQGVGSYSYSQPGTEQEVPPPTAYSTDPAMPGPRPSPLNNWPGMAQEPPPSAVYSADPSMQGPRPSSLH
jgi:hypothetical protein